ncbi:MAG: hypothetical protein RMK92_11875 [Armatimonadota bacterium]|nr:hypothetical protein [Armatimonadota bacterium]
MENNKKVLLAVVLIILAVVIFAFQYQRTKEPPPKRVTAQDVKAEIERIQNDPRMPPQAKQIAIQQLLQYHPEVARELQQQQQGR